MLRLDGRSDGAVGLGLATTLRSTRSKIGRASVLKPLTFQPSAVLSSVRSTTPMCSPRTPPSRPELAVQRAPARHRRRGCRRSPSRPGTPVLMAGEDTSMPGTAGRCSEAFSSPPRRCRPRCPNGRARPARRTGAATRGTCLRAASTMSRVCTLPARLASSQCMICGGTKPMTPMRGRCRTPASSSTSRSMTSVGRTRCAPSALCRLAHTTGKAAPASEKPRNSGRN